MLIFVYFSENTLNVSHVGPNASLAADFTETDDTLNSIFIPSLAQRIQRNGRLKSWTVAFAFDSTEIFLEVWRETAANVFTLAGQTRVQGVTRTTNTPSLTRTIELATQQQIRVLAGDVLGFFFPNSNPIPWSGSVCYESDEQMRYVYQPALHNGVPSINTTLIFTVAPLAWDPCRTYMLQATIGKNFCYTPITPKKYITYTLYMYMYV